MAAACGEDRSLRREVESLLDAFERASDFLSEPVHEGEEPGARIGRYRLVETLGEGGFGTVWLARQVEPMEREVALKIVRWGMKSRQVLERFAAERQLLALMDHPDIARVLDAGATEAGRPYFVMELVRGTPITTWCHDAAVPLPARLRLFRRVCLAVQHAHQKGVIHRDLKPTNVLVTARDGEPCPKVIDFGIARAMDRDFNAERTAEPRQLLGTLEYMAPEQIEGGSDVDTRADVYSLGALLYELIMGRPPFDQPDVAGRRPAETLRGLRETHSPAFARSDIRSGRSRPAPRELERIVRKAMARDRAKRYPSASDLAADVERCLQYQPLAAGPSTRAYRLALFVRRNRLAVVAGVTIALSLVAGLLATGLALGRARRAETRASTEAETARRHARRLAAVQDFLQEEMLGAVSPDLGHGPDVTVLQVLDRTAATLAGGRFADVPEVAADLHRHLGGLYRQIGRLEPAEHHSRRAATLRRGTGLPGELVRDLTFLIDCLVARGRHDEAAEAIAEGLSLCDDPTVDRCTYADLLSLRSNMYRAQGRPELAEADLRTALSILQSTTDPAPDRISAVLHNLAGLAAKRGENREALSLFERSLAAKRESMGDDHLDVARTEGNIALVLMEIGDFDGAEQRVRRELEVCRRVLPEDHPITGIALVNLGSVLHAKGDLTGAIDTTREALAMLRRVFGEHHLHVANALNNLGGYLEESGDLDAAEALYREALANHEATEHPSPERWAPVCYNLGSLLRRRGRLREAEAMLARAVEGKVAFAGEDDPAVVDALYWHASVQRSLGDLPGAEVGYRRAVAILRNAPDSDEKLAGALSGLGTLLLETGAFEEAAVLLAESLALRREVCSGSWLVPYTAAALGRALGELGRFSEAESLLMEAVDFEPPQGLEERRLDVANWFADLYGDWSRPGQEAEWRRRAQEIESMIREGSGR